MGDHKQERKEDGSCMGAIDSLLKKLPAQPEFKELRPHLDGIRQHLIGFCAQGVVTDMLDRHWMKRLREIAYDIEDSIDKLLVQSGFRWFKKGSVGSDLLHKFKDRIVRLQDPGKEFGLLKVGFADLVPSECHFLDLQDYTLGRIFPSDRIMCGEKPCLVGLGGPESEIVQHLMDDEKSVLAPGGLGKTTLAREVFQKKRSQFDCSYCICWPVPINT
jgi:hypothetical protein